MAIALKDFPRSAAGSEPVVSVAITSFNSEKWLGRALDSVLVQETEFPVEIVIADDCSKDATVAVAKSYQDKYPNIVRVLERKENVGTQRNYYDAFEECRLPQERAKVALQLKHLVSPAGMGESFHVLVASKGIATQTVDSLSGLSFGQTKSASTAGTRLG